MKKTGIWLGSAVSAQGFLVQFEIEDGEEGQTRDRDRISMMGFERGGMEMKKGSFGLVLVRRAEGGDGS